MSNFEANLEIFDYFGGALLQVALHFLILDFLATPYYVSNNALTLILKSIKRIF